MLKSHWSILATLMSTCMAGGAQEKSTDKDATPQSADPPKIIVFFAKDQVPDNVKIGTKVDLRRVDGRTIAGNGQIHIRSKVVVPGLEVVTLTKIDQPAAADEAIKVELKGTKEQIEKAAQYKDQKVRVVQNKPGGPAETKEIRVPLRLELAEPESKKGADGKKADGKKKAESKESEDGRIRFC